MEKTNWKNLANYDYLGAYSLDGTGFNEIILTIRTIKRERVTSTGGNSEDCIVAYFEEKTYGDKVVVKPMVMNKTNCKTIEKLYGSFIEDWVGKKIIIFATTTKFARDVVPCLRVKNELPKETIYACSICGKVIDKKMYDASVSKYGVALCSKECFNRYKDTIQENENDAKENLEKVEV
jgi:hypothetical protein